MLFFILFLLLSYNESFDWRVGSLDGRNTSCSCEGACGCAISSSLPVNSNLSIFLRSVEDYKILESECDQTAIVSSSARKINGHHEEDFSVSKNAIVKLLGSKLTKSSHRSTNLIAALSPGDTLRCSSTKFSRDNYLSKISTMSNSCDKLQDDFEIVSEAASNIGCISPRTMANTPNDTPKRHINEHKRRQCNRRYSSCDLDSLYEGIKILDSYLACKGPNVNHEHRQSITMILFGTPKHESTCNRITPSQQTRRERYMRARTWRSSEDTLSN